MPVIYDNFSDSKLQNRTGTDPWGRPLPEWTIVSGNWSATVGDARCDAISTGEISIPCSVTTGTWRVQYRYLSPGVTAESDGGCYFYYINETNTNHLHLYNPADGHWWFDYWATVPLGSKWPRVPMSYPYINMVGSQFGPKYPQYQIWGTNWHDVVMIRDDQGYVGTWLDGLFVQWSREHNTDIIDNIKFGISVDGVGTTALAMAFTNIAIYDQAYLIPNHGVVYDSGAGLVTVNDYYVDLPTIAAAVNDSGVFAYDSGSRSGICNANLLVKSGASLRLQNCTLKMAGGKKIRYEREAMFYIEGSTLQSADASPWYFESSGAYVYGATVLSIVNSVLDNFGGYFAQGLKTLYLKNTRFTNLVGYPFRFITRRPCNGELLIQGCRFEGKTGTETILFQGGDQFHQLQPEPLGMDIIDTTFENISYLHQSDDTYYLSDSTPGGTTNFTNVKTAGLQYGKATLYRFKYYLDVKVVDRNGNPVSGATVSVVNEQDNSLHSAENLKRAWTYLMVGDQVSLAGDDYFAGQQGNWFKGLVDVNDCGAAVTGLDGHTPLPADSDNTLVITDSVNANKFYTYTVTATCNGETGRVRGIDPDESWYRADPQVPVKTVEVILGCESNQQLTLKRDNLVFPNPYIHGKHQGEKVTFGNLYPEARIGIYTAAGIKVTELAYSEQITGGSVIWDISHIAGGVYPYTITSRGTVVRRGKISIIK